MYIAGESGLPLSLIFKKNKTQSPDKSVFTFSHARGGLEFFLNNNLVRLDSGKNILLPVYICQDLVESIKSLGLEVKYYDVDNKLNPILNSIKSKADLKTIALVSVRYFGFKPDFLDALQNYCSTNGMLFVEDCAHVLFSEKVKNTICADAAMFSLKKLCPISDGGIFYFKNCLPEDKVDIYNKVKRYDKKVYLKTAKLALKYILQKNIFANKRSYPLISDDSVDTTYCGAKQISFLSRRLLGNIMQSDLLDKIEVIRRGNYFSYIRFFDENIMHGKFELLFNELKKDDIPYFMPLMIKKDSSGIVNSLRAKGIPAITWPRLKKEEDNFSRANEIRRQLILLPLHESINEKHIKYIVMELKDLL